MTTLRFGRTCATAVNVCDSRWTADCQAVLDSVSAALRSGAVRRTFDTNSETTTLGGVCQQLKTHAPSLPANARLSEDGALMRYDLTHDWRLFVLLDLVHGAVVVHASWSIHGRRDPAYAEATAAKAYGPVEGKTANHGYRIL